VTRVERQRLAQLDGLAVRVALELEPAHGVGHVVEHRPRDRVGGLVVVEADRDVELRRAVGDQVGQVLAHRHPGGAPVRAAQRHRAASPAAESRAATARP
jgi:hypothetical protein